MSVSPDLTMPVYFVSVLLFNGSVDIFRVGLKLARAVKSLSLDLLVLLTVPHRHNKLFQPGGRLSLFFTSSKHA